MGNRLQHTLVTVGIVLPVVAPPVVFLTIPPPSLPEGHPHRYAYNLFRGRLS
jgi:hypothetical protein